MLFKNITTLKTLKMIVISLLLLGAGILLLSIIGPEFMRHSFLNGLGTGLITGAIGLIIIYLKKRKDGNFEEELEASFTDERVIQQKLKIIAISGVILAIALVSMLIFSIFNEISFVTGAGISLFVYAISVAVLKLYYNKKR